MKKFDEDKLNNKFNLQNTNKEKKIIYTQINEEDLDKPLLLYNKVNLVVTKLTNLIANIDSIDEIDPKILDGYSKITSTAFDIAKELKSNNENEKNDNKSDTNNLTISISELIKEIKK